MQAQAMDQAAMPDSLLSPGANQDQPQPSPAAPHSSNEKLQGMQSLLNKQVKGHGDPVAPPVGEQIAQKSPQPTSDILAFVMHKVTEFGYLPRKVQQYKDKMVSEKLLPGQGKNITITLPDEYAAQSGRLSDEDVRNTIKQISTHFKLAFTGGQRKDQKLTLNFISQQQHQSQMAVPQEQPTDKLDTIFGGGGGGGGGMKQKKSDDFGKKTKQKPANHPTTAYTQAQMMKLSKAQLCNLILKDSNGTNIQKS